MHIYIFFNNFKALYMKAFEEKDPETQAMLQYIINKNDPKL